MNGVQADSRDCTTEAQPLVEHGEEVAVEHDLGADAGRSDRGEAAVERRRVVGRRDDDRECDVVRAQRCDPELESE